MCRKDGLHLKKETENLFLFINKHRKKTMKKFIITLVLMLLLVMQLEAQKLKFYNKDGTSDEHLLSEIFRIEPQNLTENYQMKINKKDGTSVTKDLDDVEKLEYSNDNLLIYINGNSTSYAASDIASVEFYIAGGGSEETVVIGEQEWMVKNLDVSTYRNGDAIFHAESNADWTYARDNGIGACCYYNNDPANGAIYGKLYNWYAVNDSRGLAPSGYHVPSDAEWTELTNYLKSDSDSWCNNNSNYISKSIASKEYWNTYSSTCVVGNNLDANNASGFTGFPGGYRNPQWLLPPYKGLRQLVVVYGVR